MESQLVFADTPGHVPGERRLRSVPTGRTRNGGMLAPGSTQGYYHLLAPGEVAVAEQVSSIRGLASLVDDEKQATAVTHGAMRHPRPKRFHGVR